MAGTLLRPDDDIDAIVTSAKPFGLLVKTETGVTGLVRGASADVGTTVRVRVIEYDAAESRFSATLIR
ncbi:MAG TPA: S1 domain-containing protein [Pseudonocardiaceae bacterium]|jgi:ribosomal protein S1|nr:S1 domain-containing protein [Pseudonocardiaceae bacterium]